MSQRNFGTIVSEVIKRLDSFFVTQSASKPYGDKDSLVAHIDQVVFSSSESNKNRVTETNSLEAANEICVYCTRQKADYVRYCVFDALFSMKRTSARDNRRNILALTASLAIALESAPVLECIALWLATAAKEHAMFIATCLEEDFCIIMPESVGQLKSASKISERFTSMLVSAFCTKYNSKDIKRVGDFPTPLLLEVVQQWTLTSPKSLFCVISQIDQVWHTVLTTTRNPTECLPLSPLAGLVEWSIRLPFAPAEYDSMDDSYTDCSFMKLQTRLHYAILVAITQSQACRSVISQGILGKEGDFQLWSKSDAHALVGVLISYATDNASPDKMTRAVDRFAQISQVAMTYKLLTIAKEQFQSLTDPLHQTKLLELVAYGTHKPVEDVHMN